MTDSVENAAAYVPAAGAVTVLSAPWCGYCTRLKHDLTRAGIEYAEIDVDQDHVAQKVAADANGGDWLIPTVLFSDGQILVNPGIRRLEETLRAIG